MMEVGVAIKYNITMDIMYDMILQMCNMTSHNQYTKVM